MVDSEPAAGGEPSKPQQSRRDATIETGRAHGFKAIPETIPEVIFYVLNLVFPYRKRHIGALYITRRKAPVTRLWPDYDLSKRASVGALTASEVQRAHGRYDPAREVVAREAPADVRSINLLPDVRYLPCMNYDLNPGGRQGQGEHVGSDTYHGRCFKIDTTNAHKPPSLYGAFWCTPKNEPGNRPYGLYPRLAFVGTQVRIHCGREWRHARNGRNLRNGHLIRDLDGQWTELTGAWGCLRVSWLAMRRICQALDPINQIEFTHGPYDEAIAKGYEVANDATRSRPKRWHAKPRRPEEPASVGFMLAEKHSDRTWCAVAGEQAPLPSRRVGAAGTSTGTMSRTIHLCDTVGWSKQRFVGFHEP